MEESIPYPRPNYKDKDLISVEMTNGTFAKVLMQDIKNFRPVMDRYNVTQDKLVDMTVLKGNMNPEDYDINMRDMSLSGLQEIGLLPHKKEVLETEPEVVYDPLKHYAFVEYKPFEVTELPIPFIKNITLNIPYYEYEKAGLFGFQEIKNEDDEVIGRNVVYCNLRDYSISILGAVPNDLAFESMTNIGYIKGGLVVHFEPNTFVSFTFNGAVHTLAGYKSYFVNFGDDGCFAVDGIDNAYVFNVKLEKQNISTVDEEGNPTVSDKIAGNFCHNLTSSATGYTRYPFGTKINDKYYFGKTETTSNKWWLTKFGWRVETTEKPIWKYNKLLKYDYATDNWMNEPLKTLKYNMIKNGLFVANKLPCKKGDGKECRFKASDMYGDFITVYSEGERVGYHTYNFKEWTELSDEATSKLYGMWGRIWIKDRPDGISGFMPYVFTIRSSTNLQGDNVMVALFDGFIFRGSRE